MNQDYSLQNFLAEHCCVFRPRQYLEIGTREGDSLRVVVDHAPTLERIVCCDTWGDCWGGTGRGSHAHIDALLSAMLYDGSLLFLDGDSKATVPTLREQFDLILVDGDHSAEGGAADLLNVWPLCASGGCIVFHDITHPAHGYLEGIFDVFVEAHAPDITTSNKIKEGHGVGYVIRA